MIRHYSPSRYGMASLAHLDLLLTDFQKAIHCRSSRQVGLPRSQSDECIARNRRRCRSAECQFLLGPLNVVGWWKNPRVMSMVEREYECPLCGTTRREFDLFEMRWPFAAQDSARKRRRGSWRLTKHPGPSYIWISLVFSSLVMLISVTDAQLKSK